MSFGPFLGGRRICLGKTFAENIGKCILCVVANQIEFEFEDPKLGEKKPPISFLSQIPQYIMKINIV